MDFINRLLAKSPAQRMTMDQALEHDWLAGPSSQRSASQRTGLGGDSIWSIESFEGDDAFVDEAGDEDRHWSRPMTASGTNFESNGRSDSHESFSQPMGNLRITHHAVNDNRPTIAYVPQDRSFTNLQPSHPEVSPEPHSSDGRNDSFPSAPPRQIDPPDSPSWSSQDQDRDEAVASMKKRKLKTTASPHLTAFSSGSLSPPPDDDGPGRTSSRSPQSLPATQNRPKTVPVSTSTEESPNAVTNMSPRRQSSRAARPRKSMKV